MLKEKEIKVPVFEMAMERSGLALRVSSNFTYPRFTFTISF